MLRKVCAFYRLGYLLYSKNNVPWPFNRFLATLHAIFVLTSLLSTNKHISWLKLHFVKHVSVMRDSVL